MEPAADEAVVGEGRRSAVAETSGWQFAEPRNAPAEEVADLPGRETAAETEDGVANPYQAPRGLDEPLERRGGLVWLLFSLEGRIPRRTYWLGTLGTEVASFALLLLIATIIDSDQELIDALALLIRLPVIWMGIALAVKRLHDRNKSGWQLLLVLIPVAGPLWLLVELGFRPGTRGRNFYGPATTWGCAG